MRTLTISIAVCFSLLSGAIHSSLAATTSTCTTYQRDINAASRAGKTEKATALFRKAQSFEYGKGLVDLPGGMIGPAELIAKSRNRGISLYRPPTCLNGFRMFDCPDAAMADNILVAVVVIGVCRKFITLVNLICARAALSPSKVILVGARVRGLMRSSKWNMQSIRAIEHAA